MKSLQFMLCDNILTLKNCWISVCTWRKHKQMLKQFCFLRRAYKNYFYSFKIFWLSLDKKNNIVFFIPCSLKIKQVSYLLATDYLRKIQAVEISVF